MGASPIHKLAKKVRDIHMQKLTLSTREERDDIVNCRQTEATGALLNVLRFSIASDGDDEEEDDNYWHP